MGLHHYSQVIKDTVDKLSESASYKGLCHQVRDGEPFPSSEVLSEIIALSRALLFPGFYGDSIVNTNTIHYHIGVNTERLFDLLFQQILAGLCFDNNCDSNTEYNLDFLRESALKKAAEFIEYLPKIRAVLATDVEAAFNNDPAAHSQAEVIFCYPGLRAICNHRIAHKLLELGVPLIPRIISEMAHSETGIDIHPGATIGASFTIDHGTGVVIGATAILGHNVTIYQGVTLGAKNFPLDENGNPIKGIARHPIIGNDVIIYSNATILGRIKIGDGAVIGGNIWVTHDVAPGARLQQSNPKK
ncbi:MAG: serine O-acetyltransferase EpsC [Bacteroidales bacterium]|nr:serine O-acetyltransferase EpsC [Bacteroidales bacterium]